jgi:hypothetical protein
MARSVPPRRTATPTAPPEAAPTIWEPCSLCWGQRRIFHRSPNGEGLVPRLCTACLGVGERPSDR